MIVAQREMLRLAQSELTVSRLEIESYKLMLAKARREQYGQSSERARRLIEQLELAIAPLGIAAQTMGSSILSAMVTTTPAGPRMLRNRPVARCAMRRITTLQPK